MGLEGVDSIYLTIDPCEQDNENLGSKNCRKFVISWEIRKTQICGGG